MPDNRQIEDTQILGEIKQYAREIKASFAQRDLDAADYEEMYLMNWDKKDTRGLSGQRVTVEPDARNAVEGAVRLMIATEPNWSVKGDEAPAADEMEKELKRWWNNSGRTASMPHEHDLVRSGILYASMDAAISPTQDLLAYARKGKNKATIASAEQLADRTPFSIDVWNPRQGYPVRDVFGLSAYFRQTEMPAREIEARYGPLPEELIRNNRYRNMTVNLFYDREYYALWIGAGATAGEYDLTCKKHKLPMIPIMSQLIDGSMLFDKPEFQRQPLLYTLLKSGMWDSMNVYLTVAFTTILAMGTVGKWLHTAPASVPGKKLDWDWETFVIELEQGESLQPLLAKGLLDPDAAHLYEMARGKLEESTIYKQALGGAPGRSTTFSEISLLAQAGRLPLIAAQRRGGWGIAELGYTMLRWGKETPRYLSSTNLTASDIPKKFEVDCALKVSLPQDELQNANLLRMLCQGEDPLVSKAWGLEHVLGIGQPAAMQEEIWDERAAQSLWLQHIQQLARAAMAQAQDQQQRIAGGTRTFGPGGPGAGGPPMQPPPPEGLPAQAGPMMGSPDQAQQMQGIPPQQAGMLPGMGQGTVPPGMEEAMNA